MKFYLHILIAIFICNSFIINAQSIERVVFSSAASNNNAFQPIIGTPYGASLSGNNGSLTISAEYGKNTFEESQLIIDEEEDSTSTNIKLVTENLIEVFPNPTNLNINIYIVKGINENLKAQIYDLKGSLIDSWIIMENNSTKDLSFLSEGAYVLRVENSTKAYQTFKIIKSN